MYAGMLDITKLASTVLMLGGYGYVGKRKLLEPR